MKRRTMTLLTGASLLGGCGPRDEFAHQTVEAYQTDNSMRADVLQECANHITRNMAFNTPADTDECRKAALADQNVRLAMQQARANAAANAALSNAAKQFEGH